MNALSAGDAALILFGIFFGLMLLRVPVAFALGLACVPVYVIEPRLDAQGLVQETFNAYNSFILLAVPFFLLTANFMNVGGITDRLVRFSRALVGHFPGGLAQINVVLSIFFAGVSGSSTADAASQSKIFIEAQTKEGYDLSFSVAITAVSAVLAVIIPPSILMIVWGGVLQVSIGSLMLAGLVPGVLIGLAQMATVHAYAVKRNYPRYERAAARSLAGSPPQSRPRSPCFMQACSRWWSTARWGSRAWANPCSKPASCRRWRFSAWARPAHSGGCWPTTRSPRCCWQV
jgi:TRAP-type mannitol/chloroaromatic compound transport system permease large subunit